MPLNQYKVVCIPNTFYMLTAKKWNCDARNEDFCWAKHIIPAGYFQEISSTFLLHYLSPKESHEVHHLWFTDQGSSTDISSTMHGGDSRIKLVKPCQDLQTTLLSWWWAWPISASVVLFHWRFPTINHCLISSGCWMVQFILRPGAHLGATILQVTLHQPGYEVWTAGWHHQHIPECGAQWHNQ